MSVSFYAGEVEGPNLSNRNAAIVLAALGLDTEELFGEVSLREFIGRCQSYLRKYFGNPSPELETVEYTGARGARIIDCGLPEGYVNNRVHELCILAQRGLERGFTQLTWG